MSAELQAIDFLCQRERAVIAARLGYGDRMTAEASKLTVISETIAVLDDIGERYALIGGIAVGIHSGVPRATLDVDIAIRTDFDRHGLVAAMQAAGYKLSGEFEHSINLRHQSGEPVQFAFDPEFDAMVDRATEIKSGGFTIRIVTKDDLIAMKTRASEDPTQRKSKALRDKADIALLLGDVPDPDEGW